MNDYTPDGRSMIDATGKKWLVDTWHALPIPEGIYQAPDIGILFNNRHGEISNYEKLGDILWLALKLPPVPPPKTQDQLDAEACVFHFDADAGISERHLAEFSRGFYSGVAYARRAEA